MQVVRERCCGLDVHKKSVVACVLTPESQETRTFGTMTRQLVKFSEWLREHEVTHVAMESTGVLEYRQPDGGRVHRLGGEWRLVART